MSGANALVTGCNGFVGEYLARSLLESGRGVYGIDLQDGPKNGRVEYQKLDLSDEGGLVAFLKKAKVDEVYHLAAVANPRMAKADPALAYKTCVLSTLNLLEACRANPETKILFVGSSEEYKKKEGETVVYSETDELETRTVYGSSKVIAESIGRVYAEQYGVKAYFTRSFNHSGPGQAPVYVLSDFAKQIAEIKLGKRERELVTGNIDLERDFLDVRDVVEAYRLILEKGRAGEAYNVASGRAVSLRFCIKLMIESLGLSDIVIRVDANRLRQGEPKSIIGNRDLIAKTIGWVPVISIKQTVNDLASYWQRELGAS